MFKKKIFVFLMVAAVGMLLLSSVSFTTEVADISGSYVVRASANSISADTPVVKTVANIKVEALTDSIAEVIEESVRKASNDIYSANVAKAEEERARQEEATRLAAEQVKKAEEAIKEQEIQAAAANTSSGGANLSGIENEVLNLINQTRAQNGLSQLTVVQSLTDIARSRCQNMLSNNYFSHYAPDGSTFFNLLRNNGISYTNAGENLGNATPANYGSPNAFLNAWLNSASHRDNMLRSNYRFVGVGVMDAGGRRVVTTIFLN